MSSIANVYSETKHLFPQKTPLSITKRTLVTLWCLPNLNRVNQWLTSADNPLLATELSQWPRLREFLYRPYVNQYWNSNERLNAIWKHYRLVGEIAPSFLDIAPDEYRDLVAFNSAQGMLRIVLDRPAWMRFEGEVGLSLFLGVHRFYTVMFLLAGTPADPKLIVGCVQGGNKKYVSETEYKKVTKILHGMRPRDFILHTFKMLGEALGCKEILGVSDLGHRSSHPYSKAVKPANYDSIWLEHGGKKMTGGFYSLPIQIKKRADVDIPPQKRALYKRRYELIDSLCWQLRDAISSPPTKMKHKNLTLAPLGSKILITLMMVASKMFCSDASQSLICDGISIAI